MPPATAFVTTPPCFGFHPLPESMDESKSIRVKAIAHFVSLSLFSTDPLLTSDARTYLTRKPLLKSCSPPISCPRSNSLSLSYPAHQEHQPQLRDLGGISFAGFSSPCHSHAVTLRSHPSAMPHRPIHLHHTSASFRQEWSVKDDTKRGHHDKQKCGQRERDKAWWKLKVVTKA